MKKVASKIVMIQLYSNGDSLYATAVARQIKHDFPDCYLIWAIASFCKNIILNNPYVDEIMEVDSVRKNDIAAYRKFKKSILIKQEKGVYDHVFAINNIDTNQCYYDGTIRGNILRAYPRQITVPLQPVLRLLPEEIAKVDRFVEEHSLRKYKQVLLFEYAPQSGQSNITKEYALSFSEKIVEHGNYAIILSSANPIVHANPAVIDGSGLTLRETAYLTQYCTFLVGTSSGITWASTSDCGKILPMVQLLNPYARWSNSVSLDFKRFNISNQGVIEVWDFDQEKLVDCVLLALNDFSGAYDVYNKTLPIHFKTTRSIVYNLLCYLEFKYIIKHIRVNLGQYGFNLSFFGAIFGGVLSFPFKLIRNLVVKHLLKKN
jgi:hypothetical protein